MKFVPLPDLASFLIEAEEPWPNIQNEKKKTYGFSVVLTARKLSVEECDVLYEAGCDDGTIVTRSGVTFIAFDRKADSLE